MRRPDFKELKDASIDATTIATIEATVKAAIDRTLEIAASHEIGSLVCQSGGISVRDRSECARSKR